MTSNPESSHTEIMSKVMQLIHDAKNIPTQQLYNEGSYKNANTRYPQTQSEHIVSTLLDILIEQDWVDDNPILSDMTSVLSQLDMGVNKPDEWRALFALASEIDQ